MTNVESYVKMKSLQNNYYCCSWLLECYNIEIVMILD